MLNKNYTVTLDNLEIFFQTYEILIPELLFNYNINESNTSFWHITYKNIDFQYSVVTFKNYDKGFTFNFIYKEKIVSAFNINFWNNQKQIKVKNKLTIYASFLMIFWNDFILELIETIFITKNFLWLRRFDIACDIPETKQNLIKHFLQKPTTNLNFNREKQEYETYYFWSRKNDRILIRIYDKILDTFKKKKQFLYNFNWIDNLTRFEIEFWVNEINSINNNPNLKDKITYKTLLQDNKILRDLFFSRAIKYNSFFNSIDFKNNYQILHYKPLILDFNDYYLETNKIPKWWKKNAIWTSKKLIDTVWLFEFLKLCYDIDKTKELNEVINLLLKQVRNNQKTKIKINNINFNLPEKIELIEKINELLFNKNIIKSDDSFLQLNNTINLRLL